MKLKSEVGSGASAIDTGESSIISNILSLDFDSWDKSVTSPQNQAKLLGETDRRQGSYGEPGSWKAPNSSQSRFSFAIEEEAMSHLPEQSIDYHEQALKQHLFGHNFSGSNKLHVEKYVISRSQVSVPPGFSAPSRAAAPPGFTSHGRTEQFLEPHFAQGVNNLGMAELLRIERLEHSSKFYSGYEECNTRLPGSGNIFNGAYGI
ncbi:hypothetical protein SASPL_105168 [Salvia splendens]|uniref:Uncharacterized protein n=1 Tax=Salvia splendens TaxID=180675 RepID=A0A8X8YL75_SALSN|nr:hypothetical protein SASPL_105168 [Salvia splendens]